jgi:hypothetical protein
MARFITFYVAEGADIITCTKCGARVAIMPYGNPPDERPGCLEVNVPAEKWKARFVETPFKGSPHALAVNERWRTHFFKKGIQMGAFFW